MSRPISQRAGDWPRLPEKKRHLVAAMLALAAKEYADVVDSEDVDAAVAYLVLGPMGAK